MATFKQNIPALFENDKERADYYIDKIRESLQSSSKIFMTYCLLIIISILSYQLYIEGLLEKIDVLGLELGRNKIIDKWFLIIPAVLIYLAAIMGYFRNHQRATIDLLLAKYRPKEAKSCIHLLTLPPNFLVSLDFRNNIEPKESFVFIRLPKYIIAFFIVAIPVVYIVGRYILLLKDNIGDWQIITSFLISLFFIVSANFTGKEKQ